MSAISPPLLKTNSETLPTPPNLSLNSLIYNAALLSSSTIATQREIDSPSSNLISSSQQLRCSTLRRVTSTSTAVSVPPSSTTPTAAQPPLQPVTPITLPSSSSNGEMKSSEHLEHNTNSFSFLKFGENLSLE